MLSCDQVCSWSVFYVAEIPWSFSSLAGIIFLHSGADKIPLFFHVYIHLDLNLKIQSYDFSSCHSIWIDLFTSFRNLSFQKKKILAFMYKPWPRDLFPKLIKLYCSVRDVVSENVHVGCQHLRKKFYTWLDFDVPRIFMLHHKGLKSLRLVF